MTVRGSWKLTNQVKLIEIKTKIVTEIIPKYSKHMGDFDKDELNYILNLINQSLFDIENPEKVKSIFIEVDGLWRLNNIKRPFKLKFKDEIKIILNSLKEMSDVWLK